VKAGAFAVIFDEHDRVLLCHRRDIDAWNLPGGAVEEVECRVIGGTPTTSDEADAVGYFACGSLPPNTAPKQVERIADALSRAAAPFLKSQPGPSIRDVIQARER
jgi:hypothetical protein